MSVPPPFPRFRVSRFRFDKARATLSLLLLSAVVFGLGVLKQTHVQAQAYPSVWRQGERAR